MADWRFTTDDYVKSTTLPRRVLDKAVTRQPEVDFVQGLIDQNYSWIVALLAKRYEVPFQAPDVVPGIVITWLVRMTNMDVWLSVGFNPTQDDIAFFTQQYNDAKAEVLAAANAVDGLYDLTLRGKSGINKGGVISYTVASQRVTQREFAQQARLQDQAMQGTYGGRRR